MAKNYLKGGDIMSRLMLSIAETIELENMIKSAEEMCGDSSYSFDPGFSTYSCSCTAHKKSCGWD